MSQADNKMAALRNQASRRASSTSEESTCLKEIWHQNESEHLEGRIGRLEEQMEEIRAELEAHGDATETGRLKQEFLKSKREVENFKHQLKKSQNDLLETKRQLHSLQTRSQTDQKKMKELEEREQKLQKQLHSLEEEVNKKEATIRKMQKQMENMHREILNGQKALRNSEIEFQKKLDSVESRFEERFRKLEGTPAVASEATREQAPELRENCTGDVSSRDVILNDVPASRLRQQQNSLHLPPISYIKKVNFPS